MLDSEHAISSSACAGLKHSFQRTARDCPDAMFLEVLVDGEEGEDLLDTLGVEVVPTVQFIRNEKLLWEHRGVTTVDQDLAEGMLFFGDTAAGGAKVVRTCARQARHQPRRGALAHQGGCGCQVGR